MNDPLNDTLTHELNSPNEPTTSEFDLVPETTIEDAIAYLCRSDKASFYAYVVNGLEKIYARGSGTFYVTPRGHRYALVIDPDAVKRYTYNEIVAIMEHEILHIVLNHVPRNMRQYALCASNEDKLVFHLAANCGMDAAVNEIVRQNHPLVGAEGGTMDKHGWITAKHEGMPENLSYEEYLARMMSKVLREIEDPEQLFTLAMKILWDQASALAGVLGVGKTPEEDFEPAQVSEEGEPS